MEEMKRILCSAAAECGGSGSSNGEEKAGKAEGDAGPSCSSQSSKAAGDSKSRFFDDSEESEEGEEEEGSDEEVRTESRLAAETLTPTAVTNAFYVYPLGWQRR